MEDSIDTAALSRIYELKDDCDYIMMKSTIIKEVGQDVWQRHKKGVKQLLMFKGTFSSKIEKRSRREIL